MGEGRELLRAGWLLESEDHDVHDAIPRASASAARCPPTRRRPATAALALALGLATAGCDDIDNNGSGGALGDSFDRNALLAHIGENMVLPAYQAFAAETATLLAAAQAYETAVKGGGGDPATTLAALRASWERAIDLWQEAELYQFGPASGQSGVVGRQGLRDRIYSWSLVNPCRIDEELVGDAPYTSSGLIVVIGLDEIEYLLARADGTIDPAANACAGGNRINVAGGGDDWLDLVAAGAGAELTERRAEYLVEAADRLSDDAVALRDAWDPAVGDFLGSFSNAGQAGSDYADAQVAVNDVFAGLFYLDTVVKDEKLAVPAGISGPVAPDAVESPFTDRSKRHLVANLRAVQRLFLGNAPGDPAEIGFDDFLAERGASELAIDLENEIAAAIAACEAIDVPGEANGTLRAAILDAGDDTEIAAHAAIKAVTDLFKTQVVTVLNLAVPDQGAGDAD